MYLDMTAFPERDNHGKVHLYFSLTTSRSRWTTFTGPQKRHGESPQCPAEAGPALAVNGGFANHTSRINPANTQVIKVK